MLNIVSVPFHQDTLFALDHAGGILVSLKPICTDLGLAWQKQLERVKRDPVLAKGITMMVIPTPSGAQETTCLSLELVPGWLFGINETRVKECFRPKIRAYREECFHVLHDHFFARKGDVLPPPQSMPDQKALSWTEKRLIVGMYQNMGGARAAVEKALELGFGSVPALDAMMKQGEFRFLVDLDASGPSAADGVH